MLVCVCVCVCVCACVCACACVSGPLCMKSLCPQDSMLDGKPNAPSGWLTFNQFFGRHLNPGLRPIQDASDNGVVTAPADCTFRSVTWLQGCFSSRLRGRKTHT